MGIRNRLKRFTERLSGEYSSAAPEDGVTPYQRDGNPVGGEVVKARLKRPRDQANTQPTEQEEGDAS